MFTECFTNAETVKTPKELQSFTSTSMIWSFDYFKVLTALVN